jgi:transcriptional regulator with XRE-family HTH domain
MEKFGERLKIALKSSGYTQAKITEELNLSKNAITNYVNGRLPKADILYDIAKTLNVSMEWLLTGTESNSKFNDEKTSFNKNLVELNEKELNVVNMYRKLNNDTQRLIDGMLEIKVAEAESSAALAESYTCQNGGKNKNVG